MNIDFTDILNRSIIESPTREEALYLFNETEDYSKSQELFRTASRVRNEILGTTFRWTGGIASVLPCNLKPLCLYCPYWTKPKDALSIEEILRAARYLKDNGIRDYHLSAGTTLGSDGKDMVAIVQAIRSSVDPDSTITVNCGAALSRESLVALKNLGVTRIGASFETVNQELFTQVKPGDSFQAKNNLCQMIGEAGLELGSGLLAGLGCTECRESCSIIHGGKAARHNYEDYVNFIFHVKQYPNLKSVYVSRFFPYTGIPMADHPRCSALEGARIIGIMRLVLRDIRIGPAAGWSYDDIPLWVAAGGGNEIGGIHVTREPSYQGNWYMHQALDYRDNLEYRNTIPTATKFLHEMGMSVTY